MREAFSTTRGSDQEAVFEARESSIPADLAHLREAREFAAQAAVEFGFAEDTIYAIKLAMSEAVANAVQHGSDSPADAVEMSVVAEGDGLVFVVRDSGRFRPRVKRGGPLPDRGRGLEFMGALMDDVDLRATPNGTVLRFSKRRG
jgi:anti-sigma regulatory factor (Ser/Thr protein kinase)